MATVSRNDPCPCGSGKKFKHCCLPNQSVDQRAPLSNSTQEKIAQAYKLMSEKMWDEAICDFKDCLNDNPRVLRNSTGHCQLLRRG